MASFCFEVLQRVESIIVEVEVVHGIKVNIAVHGLLVLSHEFRVLNS